MIELTQHQVEYILNDIRRSGIEMEELQHNLLDHICCVIENEMPVESNFEEFYRSILPRFFRRELREIQEETNLLLKFKNYYTMKKLLIYSGLISAVSFIAGSFFKIMHWPGASVMLLLGVVTLCFMFLPIFLVIKTKESEKTIEKLVIIIGSLFGIIISMSTLFKVMHWPGANFLWTISLGMLLLVFLPVYYLNGIRKEENKTNTIISSIMILVAGSLLFMLTNLRSSQRAEVNRFEDNMFLQNQYLSASELNNSIYIKTRIDSSLKYKALKEKAAHLCNTAENIKSKIYQTLNQAFEGANSYEGVMNNSKARDNYDIISDLLFDETGNPKKDMQELINELEQFNTFINKDFEVKSNVQLFKITNSNQDWVSATFYQLPAESVLRNLTKIQIETRYLEAVSLR